MIELEVRMSVEKILHISTCQLYKIIYCTVKLLYPLIIGFSLYPYLRTCYQFRISFIFGQKKYSDFIGLGLGLGNKLGFSTYLLVQPMTSK